jgi:hypothetical protein
VLVVGQAEQVTDARTVRRLAAQAYSEPWPGGSREVWICIAPERISGRRIRVP